MANPSAALQAIRDRMANAGVGQGQIEYGYAAPVPYVTQQQASDGFAATRGAAATALAIEARRADLAEKAAAAAAAAAAADAARKINTLDVNAPHRKRLNSFFGGMHRTPIPSDGRYWRLGCGFYMGAGTWWLINRRGFGHYEDKNCDITLRVSTDHGVSWGPETVIYGPDGFDKYCDTMGRMPDGSLLIVTMRRSQDANGVYNQYTTPLGIQITPAGVVSTFEFTFASTAYTAFHYGRILPYPPGGPDARQVWFYSGNGRILNSIYNPATKLWAGIASIDTSPAGELIAEPAIQFLATDGTDNRAYMICGNTAGPNYTPYGKFSADGTNWGPFVALPISLGRAPPFIVPHPQSGTHRLVARSANPGTTINLNPEYLGTMSEMVIDPAAFYASSGQSGFGPWSPVDAHEAWVHGQGNFESDGPDGTAYGFLTCGERQYTLPDGSANNSIQGSPNQQVMYSSLPRAAMSQSGVLAAMTSGQGRWITPNPFFQVATKGKAKRLTGSRRIGPDGHGLMRVGGAGDAYGMLLPGGRDQANVFRIGREPGTSSTALINTIIVLRGEEAKSFQNKPIFPTFAARAGNDFSDPLGLRVNLFTHPDDMPSITSTDGSLAGGFSVNPTIFVPLVKGQVQPFGRPFGMPETFGTCVIRLSYLPSGVAGADDWFELLTFGTAAGTRQPFFVPQPIGEARARCRRIIWTNYPAETAPGTDVSANALVPLRMFAATAVAGAAQLSLPLPEEMDRDPDVSAFTPAGVGGSPAQGARFLNEAGAGAAAAVIPKASRKVVSVENTNAPAAANTRYSGMLVLDASNWPTI